MTTLEQHVQQCMSRFGNPAAIEPCSTNCNGVVMRVSNEIKPVWFCPFHKRVWDNPDGSSHDPTVLERARRFYGINTSITDHSIIYDEVKVAIKKTDNEKNQNDTEEGDGKDEKEKEDNEDEKEEEEEKPQRLRPSCHSGCQAISLSHTLANEGRWNPPRVCVVFCPIHKYMHACRGDETPCNDCYACSKDLWCIYRCRSTQPQQNSDAPPDETQNIRCYTCSNKRHCPLHSDKNAKPWMQVGEPVCPWSGRILSNIDAPITKATKQQGQAITAARVKELRAYVPADEKNKATIVQAIAKQTRRRSSACSETYIKNWLREAARRGPTHTEFRDIPELVGSWHSVSEEWPTTLHIAGWVFLLSAHYSNSALLGLCVREKRRAWIDTLADTPFGKKNAASCADAIVCHMMQNPISDIVLIKIRRDMSLFESDPPVSKKV